MYKIRLKDNRRYQSLVEELPIATEHESERKKIISSLREISCKNVSGLINRDFSNLFVFSNEDNSEDKWILSLDNYDDYDKCTIETGNIAGFIGCNSNTINLQIDISSRFSDDTCGDFFLNYMLLKVFKVNLAVCQHNNSEDKLFDFLILLFPYFLNNALKKGLFKKYEKVLCNDSNLKGAINIPRFLKSDIPFLGKIAYDNREFLSDNNLTQLVRHTIETIKTGVYKSILVAEETKENVKKIIEITPTYSKSKREIVIGKNSKMIRHPYYTEWTELQRICLAILRHKRMGYGNNGRKMVYGVLFDVAWLWEEYLNTMLSKKGFKHPSSYRKKGGVCIFGRDSGKSGRRYPDFYKDDVVLDAKYKYLENKDSVSKMDRDDIHQMVTYIHSILQSKNDIERRGYFLYPATSEMGVELPEENLRGLGGKIGAYGLLIPQGVKSYREFKVQIEQNETEFINNFC